MYRLLLAALLCLPLSGCMEDAFAGRRGARGRRDPGGPGSSVSAWTNHICNTTDHTTMCFDMAYTEHMYQEQGFTGTPVTAADANSDVIGQVASPSNGMLAQSIATGRRPTLGEDSSISYADFDGADDGWEVSNSLSLAKSFWESGTGSIAVIFNNDNDAAARQLLDNSQGTEASNGISLRLDTDDALRFQVQNTSGSGEIFDYDSTGDFTFAASGGWYLVVVTADNASGGNAYSVPCSNDGSCDWSSRSTGTFSRQVAPGGGTGSDNIHIGVRAGAGTNFDWDGQIAFVMMADEAWTEAEVQAIAGAGARARTSDSLLDCSLGASNGYCNFLSHWYDLTDTSSLWQDTSGRTTAVSSDNDPVGTIANKADPNGYLDRDANAPAAGNRCLYDSDGTGCHFDGVDDDYTFLNGQRGGGLTVAYAAQNDDHTNGSHWLVGADRLCVTGDNYVSNPGGQAYQCCHPATGSCGSADLVTETGVNVLGISRSESSFHHRVLSGGSSNTGSGSSSDALVVTGIASETIAGWQGDGDMYEILIIQATATDEQFETVQDAIAAKHGI